MFPFFYYFWVVFSTCPPAATFVGLFRAHGGAGLARRNQECCTCAWTHCFSRPMAQPRHRLAGLSSGEVWRVSTSLFLSAWVRSSWVAALFLNYQRSQQIQASQPARFSDVATLKCAVPSRYCTTSCCLPSQQIRWDQQLPLNLERSSSTCTSSARTIFGLSLIDLMGVTCQRLINRQSRKPLISFALRHWDLSSFFLFLFSL